MKKSAAPSTLLKHHPPLLRKRFDLSRVMMNKSVGAPSTWVDLPNDLIEQVLERLSFFDYVRFGAVCRGWRSGWQRHILLRRAPRSPFTPCLCFCPKNKRIKDRVVSYHHVGQKLYSFRYPYIMERILASSKGWLLFQEQVIFGLQLWLTNPVSGVRIRLPRLGQSDYQSTFLLASPNFSDTIVVLEVHEYRTHCSRVLFYWRAGERGWTRIFADAPLRKVPAVKDAVFHGSKLYAICRDGAFFAIDFSMPIPYIEFLDMIRHLTYRYLWDYLVEVDSQIVLLQAGQIDGFEVWRADLSGKKWIREEGLGDYAVFIEPGSSFSVRAADVPGVRRNCIYSTSYIREEGERTDQATLYSILDLGVGRWFHGLPMPTDVCSEMGYGELHWFVPTLTAVDAKPSGLQRVKVTCKKVVRWFARRLSADAVAPAPKLRRVRVACKVSPVAVGN